MALEHVELRYWYQPLTDPTSHPTHHRVIHAAPEIVMHENPDIDLALIKRTGATVSVLEGGSAQSNFYDYKWLASEREFASGEVRVGDNVLMSGFPGLETSQVDPTRPITVAGVIASDPRFPYALRPSDVRPESVLCHAFSWGGMSGGPVIGLAWTQGRSRLVGVNAGHVRVAGEAAGVLTHFVRSSAIRDVLERVGVAV